MQMVQHEIPFNAHFIVETGSAHTYNFPIGNVNNEFGNGSFPVSTSYARVVVPGCIGL
jgi:hypothetical protein